MRDHAEMIVVQVGDVQAFCERGQRAPYGVHVFVTLIQEVEHLLAEWWIITVSSPATVGFQESNVSGEPCQIVEQSLLATGAELLVLVSFSTTAE